MPLPALESAYYPTPDEVLSQTLADIRYAYDVAGIPANVEEGGEHYVRAKAFAARVSIAIRNGELAIADMLPTTAQGDGLVELAAVYGVEPRPESKAAGFILAQVTGAGTVTIPAGYAWSVGSGARYVTIAASTVANGEPVEVIAVSAGTAGNLDPGTQGQWELATVGGLKPIAIVDGAGIDGGEPADDTERLRARLIRRLRYPGVGGSWSQVAQWAEEATAAVQAAFVYTARGPSSYDVAVSADSDDRTIASSATVASIKAHILANMPGHADLNVTSLSAFPLDIVLDLTVPLPLLAGGAGGGWIDSVPWPSTADSVLAKVTAVAPLFAYLVVNSTSADPPVAGDHFSIWDPTAKAMKSFVVQSVAGVSGAYQVTVDPAQSDSASFVTAGMYISAGAANLAAYAESFRQLVRLLGPGEKTDSPDILPRGRRLPGPEAEWPAALTAVQLGRLTTEYPEIIDVLYAARYQTNTTTTVTTAPIPSTTADPPRVLTLARLAFRRKA